MFISHFPIISLEFRIGSRIFKEYPVPFNDPNYGPHVKCSVCKISPNFEEIGYCLAATKVYSHRDWLKGCKTKAQN